MKVLHCQPKVCVGPEGPYGWAYVQRGTPVPRGWEPDPTLPSESPDPAYFATVDCYYVPMTDEIWSVAR